MRVVATAGHVDHGKSTLLRALTGMEPDRWDEERRRGLTIDLGFVWTDLHDAAGEPTTVAFVDVPGHERFIGNMLAGAGAVDRALFVVAADAGWSAQSDEHLEILDLLGVRGVAIAVTKVGTVDPDRVRAVADHVRERVRATALADAPIVETDAVAGIGIDELARVIVARLASAPSRAATGRTRLWADRSFAVAGAGTVVTGTIWDGPLTVGDAVSVLPTGTSARVRGLQSLGQAVDRVEPGSRVAVNLSGVSHHDVRRGNAIVRAEHAATWATTTTVATIVEPLAGHTVTGKGAWHLHVGTAEVSCRPAPVLGSVDAGDVGPVRFELDEPLALQYGDRFVLRESGRRATVAGGVVLDPDPAPRARGVSGRLERAEVLEALGAAEDVPGRVRAAVDAHGGVRSRAGVLSALGLTELAETTDPERVGALLVRSDRLAGWLDHLRTVVGATDPSRGMAVTVVADALRDVACPEDLRRTVVERAVARGDLARHEAVVVLPDHEREYLDAVRHRQDALVAALEADPVSPPDPDPLVRELGLQASEVQTLLDRGTVVRTGPLLFAATAVDWALDRLGRGKGPGATFTASEAREAWGTTRKYAVPLLELLTATGRTTFDGEHHRLQQR